MRARGRCRHGWKSTECCEPAICVVSKRDISLHNIQRNIWKIQDGGCWHVRFVAFVTILLNRPHRSRRFIYFKALFSCKKHQGKIYKTQRVLVANLATNFWILVASTIILVALATVLGAISCPVLIQFINLFTDGGTWLQILHFAESWLGWSFGMVRWPLHHNIISQTLVH